MYNLGVCFEKGEGVEQNWTKAAEWFTKAAENGHTDAMYNLGYGFHQGKGVEQNWTKAIEVVTTTTTTTRMAKALMAVLPAPLAPQRRPPRGSKWCAPCKTSVSSVRLVGTWTTP